MAADATLLCEQQHTLKLNGGGEVVQRVADGAARDGSVALVAGGAAFSQEKLPAFLRRCKIEGSVPVPPGTDRR